MNNLVTILLVALAVAYTTSSPVPVDEPIPILRSSNSGPNPDGSYSFNYETGNGIKHDEIGKIKQNGAEGIVSVQGRFSYTSDDGTPVDVTYTADENGYQPRGESIPAIPEQILRALEYISKHPEQDNL